MAYILDQKTNLESYLVPVGPSNTVTAFKDFIIVDPVTQKPNFGVYNTGTILIGNQSNPANSNIIINTGVDFKFRQIIDTTITNYLLTHDDYAVEIISDAINTVTLPSALGNGGRTYLISRGSTNNALVIASQYNETIDSRPQIQLRRIHDHVKVMSNNIDTWYIG